MSAPAVPTNFLEVMQLLWPLAIVLLGVIGGVIFERRAIVYLRAIAAKTGWPGYRIVLSSLRWMTLLWFILAGFFCASLTLKLDPPLRSLFDKTLLALTLMSVTVVIARLAVGFIELYSGNKDDNTSPITSLFENLTKLAIFSLGVLIVIQSLGISITPLLTALGVGGVSIGLALQNTLANLFSGLNIILSKKVRPGDYLELSTGEAGYVTDVEWRYTVIQDIRESQIVIPNSKIVSSAFKNYGLPQKYLTVDVRLGFAYGVDLAAAEKITIEVARELQTNCLHASPEKAPFFLYENFGYYSVDARIFVHAKDYLAGLYMRHELIKRLHARYTLEDIELAFPIAAGFPMERDSSGLEVSPRLSERNYDSR
ncbi:MAG: mechanosensitive ion channel family protein [Geitlerinemataceae cyanobacterium]